MIGDQRVLAVIPARGGSKGVPGKNLREAGGRPLIAWAQEAAHGSRYVDRTVLSSEDPLVIAAARALGVEVPFVRPESLARDDTPGIEPVLHALAELPGYDLVVLLQPTSPLRSAADVDACLELLIASGAETCVSVREAADHPYWTYRIAPDGRIAPFVDPPTAADRRQDLPRAVAVNGAVYAARVAALVERRSFIGPATVAYAMPDARSLDIDTEADLAEADSLLRGARR